MRDARQIRPFYFSGRGLYLICKSVRITLKKNPIVVQYTLHDYTIHEVTHAKYLGVVIDSKLSWSEHIKQVTNKANKVKGFLQRNLYNCPISIKINCYKSMIKPIVEYACTIWAPHTQKDIADIESVQRRATRFVCNNYSSFTKCQCIAIIFTMANTRAL